jgi:Hydrophobic seed protein
MATKSALFALLLTFNLLFSTLTNSHYLSNPSGGGSSGGSCPIEAGKFNVFKDVVNIIKGIKVGLPGTSKCCPLIKGLATVPAATCLCRAIKANVLGVKFDFPLDLKLILTYCGKDTIN